MGLITVLNVDGIEWESKCCAYGFFVFVGKGWGFIVCESYPNVWKC